MSLSYGIEVASSLSSCRLQFQCCQYKNRGCNDIDFSRRLRRRVLRFISYCTPTLKILILKSYFCHLFPCLYQFLHKCGIETSTFVRRAYHTHNLFHWSHGMAFIYQALGESRFIIIIVFQSQKVPIYTSFLIAFQFVPHK